MATSFTRRELATVLAALRHWQRSDSADTMDENDIATEGDTIKALSNAEIDDLCERVNTTTAAHHPYYSAPIRTPATKRDGLANAVQMIVNNLEAGDIREALLSAVDLHQDVIAKSNPYLLPGIVTPRRKVTK